MSAKLLPFTQKQPADFGAALAATKVADDKKKAGKMPTLEATPEVKDAVDQYQEAKAQAKQAEAVMDVTGAVIGGFVREVQDRDGYAGKFSGSYAVMGNKATAKVIYANKFNLSPEDEAELASVLGLENFGQMVKKNFTVKLRDEVFTDEAKQKELMALVGDRFPEFFETKMALAVCEDFNKLVYAVVKPEELDNLRVYARQYKPSIR